MKQLALLFLILIGFAGCDCSPLPRVGTILNASKIRCWTVEIIEENDEWIKYEFFSNGYTYFITCDRNTSRVTSVWKKYQ